MRERSNTFGLTYVVLLLATRLLEVKHVNVDEDRFDRYMIVCMMLAITLHNLEVLQLIILQSSKCQRSFKSTLLTLTTALNMRGSRGGTEVGFLARRIRII